jgi:branched-chain amino acid transport system substrate-binding protein
VNKKKLVVAALAVGALFATTIPATATDLPGLVPTKSWNSGQSTVKIGLIGEMTSFFAVLGQTQKNSLQIVADQINAAGGIGGAKIQIVVRDVAGLNPTNAANASKEFAGDSSIKLVVGPSVSSLYGANAPVFEAAKKLNCQPGVAALDFTNYTYGFRSQDYYKDSISALLTVLQRRHITKVGLLYEAGTTGDSFDAYYKAVAANYGITYLGWQVITSAETSHNTEMQKLIDAGAQAIMISNNAFGAYSAKSAKDLNYKGLLFSGSGSQNIAFTENGGDDFAGTLMAAPNYQWPLRDKSLWKPGYKAHTDAAVAAYGFTTGAKSGNTSPNSTAIAADCLYAFAVAANKARSFSSDKVQAAMSHLDIPASMTPSGVRIHPGSNHNFYGPDGISVYEWRKDAKGWFTVEVNPIARLAGSCREVGAIATTAAGGALVCKKSVRGLFYAATTV